MKCIFFVVSCLLPSFVIAADVTEATKLPIIKVTATPIKNEVSTGILGNQDILKIPFSLNHYDRQLIDKQQATSLNAVLKNSPMAQDFAIGDNFEHVSIRGFSADTRTGFRRNGLPFLGLADVALESVEKIEVLQGVSGFLYGFGRPSGVINFVTKAPTDETLWQGTARLQSSSGYYAHLDTGGTLDAGIGYRLNMAGEKIGNFNHRGDKERWMVSSVFSWDATEDLTLGLNIDVQHQSLVAQSQLPLLADKTLPPFPNPHTLLGQPWARYETDTMHLSLNAEYDLSENWWLDFKLGYSNTLRQSVFPNIYQLAADGSVLESDIWYSPDQEGSILSSQLHLRGEWQSGSFQHESVIGMSHYVLNGRFLGYVWPDFPIGNIYQPNYVGQPEIPVLPPKRKDKNQQYSVFIADTMTLNKHWQLLGGLRYVNYHNRNIDGQTGLVSKNYQTHALTPSLALLYQPMSNLSFYASYAEGLESGGIAPLRASVRNAGESMSPVRSQQYEIGVKGRINKNLLWTASAFRINRDLQYVNTGGFYVQDGLQQHDGVELTTEGQLSKNLFITAGVAWLNPRLKETGNLALRNKIPAGVAQQRANIFLEYQVPQITDLAINAGWYYQGKSPFDTQNTVFIPSYNRWDAGMSYAHAWGNQQWQWRLSIENLTDKVYWSAAVLDGLTLGMPRSIKLSTQVTWK
jgi:iron complex outermembrane receptor protein